MELLLRNRSYIISNETILYTIWDDHFDESAIRKLVSRIHSKIGIKLIQNRAAQGYIIP